VPYQNPNLKGLKCSTPLPCQRNLAKEGKKEGERGRGKRRRK
jgi:hypothetical protein